MKDLKTTQSVADVNVDTYDAVYVPGKLLSSHHKVTVKDLNFPRNLPVLLVCTGPVVTS